MTLLRPLLMQASGADPAIPFSAAEVRALLTVLIRNEGILQAAPPGDVGLKVTQRAAGANFSVDVATGAAVIQGDDVTDQNMYVVKSTAVENLVIPAPPVAGTRVHRVIARIKDKLHNGTWTTYEWTLEVLPDVGSGTPALPNSAISLATVSVTVGQASVLNANITDLRVAALLGPGRANRGNSDAERPPNPAQGETLYRIDKGYEELWTGTAWVPGGVTPPIPVEVNSSATVVTASTTYVVGSTLLSTTFVAPPSGRVYVTITAQVEAAVPSAGFCTWQMHTGASSAGAVFLTANDDNGVAMQQDNFVQASTERLVTGLTAGATYYLQSMLRTTGAGSATAFLRRLLVKPA